MDAINATIHAVPRNVTNEPANMVINRNGNPEASSRSLGKCLNEPDVERVFILLLPTWRSPAIHCKRRVVLACLCSNQAWPPLKEPRGGSFGGPSCWLFFVFKYLPISAFMKR